MKKLLALLMLVLPVMGMFNDVEEYSGKKPLNQFVFSTYFKKDVNWEYENDRLDKTIYTVNALFDKMGFVHVNERSKTSIGTNEQSDEFWLKNKKDVALVQYWYKNKLPNIRLNSIDFDIAKNNGYPKLYNLSSGYVHLVARKPGHIGCKHQLPLREDYSIIQRIEKEHSTDFIHRIIITTDAEFLCSFYFAYDTEQQFIKTKTLLKEVKNLISF
jgi:hypothetical protein